MSSLPDYRRLDRTADLGIVVRAPTWQRLFVDSTLALTDARVPLRLVRDTERARLAVAAESKEALLVRWLDGCLGLFASEGLLPSRMLVEKFDGRSLEAVLLGDKYERVRHGGATDVASVVAEKLVLQEEEADGGFSARIFFRPA